MEVVDKKHEGLEIDNMFVDTDLTDIFSIVEWGWRTAQIKNDKGEVLFEQEVEAPTNWSDQSVQIVASKYLYGDASLGDDPSTGGRESSFKQLIHRVAEFISKKGHELGYYDAEGRKKLYNELCYILINQMAAFNSPVWFNVGLNEIYGIVESGGKKLYNYQDTGFFNEHVEVDPYEYPQASACFIVSVEDSIDDIWNLMSESARLFKYGSGVGADWSKLRSTKETISGGGKPSGPVSFMKVQDTTGGTIKSGGKTRRAAIMQTLSVHHPDIMEFVNAKQSEEKKAWALIEQGYDSSFNGQAYGSVAFQNVNQSVRVSDMFMDIVSREKKHGKYNLYDVNGDSIEKIKAHKVLRAIAEGTWLCGDPGIQYHDTIQRWHTALNSGPINSSNPCCFVGETLIDTSEGRIKIKDLTARFDKDEELPYALSYDIINNKTVRRKITNAWMSGLTTQTVVVKTDKGITVECTPEHRFLTFDGDYIEAKDLKPGTRLIVLNDENDKVSIVEFKDVPNTPVYDIEVEETNNFFVSNGETLHSLCVHNSEYMFLDDSACNLASINLLKFLNDDNTIDVDSLEHTSRILITCMDILVSTSGYPSRKIAENSHKFRPLGLGFANLGALLMSAGVAYDSDRGRNLACNLMALIHASAYYQSSVLAEVMGAFEGFDVNREAMLNVVSNHLGHLQSTYEDTYTLYARATNLLIEAQANAEETGYRNSQVTVIAPTGTIAYLMGCDTTGIEPTLGLVTYKLLAGEGNGMIKIVNKSVERGLRALGYDEETIQKNLDYIEHNDTIEGGYVDPEDFDVFATSFGSWNTIPWEAHLKMMAACQPFVSGAISKTINMPEDSTVEDIENAYIMGWKLGLKAVAIYRDGSKRSQPVSIKKESPTTGIGGDGVSDILPEVKTIFKPVRTKLPDDRPAKTHKFSVGGHEGYLTIGYYPGTNKPGEIFIRMSKEGSTISGLLDAFATCVSLCLQWGVSVQDLYNKFSFTRFEPSGFNSNPNIKRMSTSIIDYIVEYMMLNTAHNVIEDNDMDVQITVNDPYETDNKQAVAVGDGPACSVCGTITVRAGSCHTCPSCGNSTGCG